MVECNTTKQTKYNKKETKRKELCNRQIYITYSTY